MPSPTGCFFLLCIYVHVMKVLQYDNDSAT